MNWSFRIARISGIEVRINVLFFLLLAVYGFPAWQRGGWPQAVLEVSFVLVLFLCVLLHEFGHAFAARAYGIRTLDITLWPLGGIARLERMPEKPSEEMVVALAGPLVNVVIAGVLWAALGASGTWASPFDPRADSLLHQLLKVNLMLVVFNMIPAFPMDGGRVLRALLAMRLPYARATQVAASVGQFFAFIFGAFGLLGVLQPGSGNPILLLVALFIYTAAQQEAGAAQMRAITRGTRLEEAMLTEFRALPPDARLSDAVELLRRTSQREFPVVEGDGRVRGILTRNDLIDALAKGGLEAPAADFMRRDIPTIPYYAPFEEAFELMEKCECPALPVVDRQGRLVGLITPENVGELLMVRSALDKRGAGKPAWRQAPAT